MADFDGGTTLSMFIGYAMNCNVLTGTLNVCYKLHLSVILAI